MTTNRGTDGRGANGGIKRLFLDIETSPNIGFFWSPGHQISIGYENIIHERGIICICYKWEGDKEVSSVQWKRKSHDDTAAVKAVADLITEADEVVTHNGDRFDLPWIRGRCLRLGYPLPPKIVSQDTCGIARRMFNLNSNRLDYIAQYLGFGGKLATGFGLWKSVVLENSRESLDKMVEYCKRDVELLEKVWNKIKPYVPAKTHISGRPKECPECGSKRLLVNRYHTTAGGMKTVQLRCRDCRKFTTMGMAKAVKAKLVP